MKRAIQRDLSVLLAVECQRQAARERERHQMAARLAHGSIECTRHALSGAGWSWEDASLTRLLGEDVPDYMRSLLDNDGVGLRVTLKRLADEGVVDTLFRCQAQTMDRLVRQRVDYRDSAPFLRFFEQHDEGRAAQLSWVHIPDVRIEEGLPAGYAEQLEALRVRSILAFPLRPHDGALDGRHESRAQGFLSIDSPAAGAFASLFGEDGLQAQAFDSLFAVADSLATILVSEQAHAA